MFIRFIRLGLLSLIFASTFACTLESRLLKPLPTTFLEGANLKSQLDTLPFDHSWIAPGEDLSRYNKVYIKPIRSDLLAMDRWLNSSSVAIQSKEDYSKYAREITTYFDQQLREKFKSLSDSSTKLQLAEKVGPQTIKLEIALTELEFGHPIANAGALASPLPGTGAMVAAISDPHASFAARLSDGQTGKLLATIADRKFSPTRIVDLNKFTVTSTIREICGLWSEQLAATLAGAGKVKVTERTFDLMPY